MGENMSFIKAPAVSLNSSASSLEGALLCLVWSRCRPWHSPASHMLRGTCRSHSPHALGRRRNPRFWLKLFSTWSFKLRLQPPGLGTRAARLNSVSGVWLGPMPDLGSRSRRPVQTRRLPHWCGGQSRRNSDLKTLGAKCTPGESLGNGRSRLQTREALPSSSREIRRHPREIVVWLTLYVQTASTGGRRPMCPRKSRLFAALALSALEWLHSAGD